MKKHKLVFWCLFSLFILSLTSCASRKNIVYFQPDETELKSAYDANTPKLLPGDILTISVTADDIRSVEPFNQLSTYQNVVVNNTNPFLPTYTIDEEGEINFPKLGRVKLAGLTRLEAIDLLQQKIGQYVISPGVQLTIKNFRVTVMGEVVRPNTYLIEDDRITILEALGKAGDMTINGVRNNVLVVRENNGVKKEYRVDLTSREALNSPVYYLAQNDVIYVEPNSAKVQSAKYTQNNSLFISIASIIITIISIIVR
ncbi:MAG: polysaccharide biosynthesis/export family protein [Flavobacteriaceae bacterium]|jgi:polysaccharide export outer membrane protein|nr:polysaccharide biosynthesis/export family protein [Flavobacteriaceae bacterium]